MKSKIYLYQVEVLIIWIAIVVMLFKYVPSKQIAGAVAGLGFVLLPSLFLIYELRQPLKNKFYIFVLGVFLLTNALPIFLLRILNWGVDFSELSLVGIPANKFHGISNIMYLIMLITSAVIYFKVRKMEKVSS